MAVPVYRLIPLDHTHIEMVRQWRNQDRIRRNMYTTQYITPEQQLTWFELLQGDLRRRYLLFLQENRPVGVLSYTGISGDEAHLGYYLGDERIWPGTGLLLELAALDYAFDRLGLETLIAEVLEFNTGPQKIHELFGYQRVRTRHEATWREGQPVAALVFRYRCENWRSNRSEVLRKLPRQIGQAAALLQI